jgi:Zn-dependent protease
MRGSLRLGKIAGIAIDIHFSWLIIFILLTTTLALDWFPSVAARQSTTAYWIAGIVASLVLFASVLAHELAHSLVAQSRGMPVKSITLFIFGGVSNLEREPERPGVEFVMAFVGPLTSLIIGAIFGGIFVMLSIAIQDANPLVTAVAGCSTSSPGFHSMGGASCAPSYGRFPAA